MQGFAQPLGARLTTFESSSVSLSKLAYQICASFHSAERAFRAFYRQYAIKQARHFFCDANHKYSLVRPQTPTLRLAIR